ncbi:MAG: hypothetical protein R3C26_22390 [Calditrichia bacterium]
MLTPDKGAIAAIASSGFIAQRLFDALAQSDLHFRSKSSRWRNRYIGENSLFDNGGEYNFNGDVLATQGFGTVKHEMVYQYNLIGDPYVKLQYATEDLPIELNSNTPLPGETLEVSIKHYVKQCQTAAGLVMQAGPDVADRVPLFGVSQSTTVLLPIDADFSERNRLVRAYLSDGHGRSQRIGAHRREPCSRYRYQFFCLLNRQADDTVQVKVHRGWQWHPKCICSAKA